ncbi:MAG: carbamoyltransferase HypF [Verrucomicrobia bacterium]|nr:MAG: carbamoyltransferase HypF [Verrucomicrobiota bacterium]
MGMLSAAVPEGPRQRLRVVIRGAVQGVGFRPFVYRLARELGLGGWVSNTVQGVFIEAEGSEAALRLFLDRLEREKPPRSFIQSLEATHLPPEGEREFAIRPSQSGGRRTALVLPDIATCPECLAEVFDPRDRRHRYPFTNCTHCGPRFSIIEALPYDRPNTSMRRFPMCRACRQEYEDPANRRFHAQPNACPDCGPQLAWWDRRGRVLAGREEALQAAARALREGAIVAVKGLGGFHLMVRADDAGAVARLRQRKRRGPKPFAVMAPDLEAVRGVCRVDAVEERALRGPEAPIVLLRRARFDAAEVAPEVAPGNPWLGVMLPYTPLHHLLVRETGGWVVATSGNVSDEPICIDEREAVERLGGIADFFLVHDRPIVRPVDDSLLRVVLGREMLLRRSRGYAPLPIVVKEPLPPVIAMGTHLKNTVAVAEGREVFLSQHLGDLENIAALTAFERATHDLVRLMAIQPKLAAHDAHPDYASSQAAQATGLPTVCVQHHYAHVLACMAENNAPAPALGVSWDGAGLGLDGEIWGGEFLLVTEDGFKRVGCLRSFPLPGGEKAIKEPRRTALGLLFAMRGGAIFQREDLAPLKEFPPAERRVLKEALERGVNCPPTTSAGRLFDAVASILGLRQIAAYEGQAATDLEFAMEPDDAEDSYPYGVTLEDAHGPGANGEPLPCPDHRECHAFELAPQILRIDWQPIIEAIFRDLECGEGVWAISARFHNTLSDIIVDMARRIGVKRVLLTGGCFQNHYLLERTVTRLRTDGYEPFWHQRVPPNDGGIALGQAVAAGRETARSKSAPTEPKKTAKRRRSST